MLVSLGLCNYMYLSIFKNASTMCYVNACMHLCAVTGICVFVRIYACTFACLCIYLRVRTFCMCVRV